MRLIGLSIENFRSIKEQEDIRVEPLQALVAENNAGKSNVLRSIECFLSAGSGGVQPDDFNDQSSPITIEVEVEFGGLTDTERRKLRTYLLGDRLILQKKLSVIPDARSMATSGRGI